MHFDVLRKVTGATYSAWLTRLPEKWSPGTGLVAQIRRFQMSGLDLFLRRGLRYLPLTEYQMIADTPDRFFRFRYDGFPLAVSPTT
jgi:hypothetical protein